MSNTEKFRVGVVTIWEVDAVDAIDATGIAEGALSHMIHTLNTSGSRRSPVIEWQHSNGYEYRAALLRGPAEVGVALRNHYLDLSVHQPRREADVGCPCVCNSGGFCGGCGHAGCGGRR